MFKPNLLLLSLFPFFFYYMCWTTFPNSAHPVLSPFVNLSDILPQIAELFQSFNFPSGGSCPITLILVFALHCTFPNFSMLILRWEARKVHGAQDVGVPHLSGEAKWGILSHYQHFHDSPKYLIGFFTAHWHKDFRHLSTQSQDFLPEL